MIARLKGIVDSIYEGYLILDVGGVGYKIFVSSKTLHSVVLGEAVSLNIETVVREDALNLFGFLTDDDKQWFEVLTSVQGVGTKASLAIQSIMDSNALYVAVGAGDKIAFGRASGVGPKLASRIVLELKDKVAKMGIGRANVQQFDNGISDKKTSNNNLRVNSDNISADEHTAGLYVSTIMEDAISALVNLGFNRSQAFSAVGKSVEKISGDITVSGIIPIALKELN